MKQIRSILLVMLAVLAIATCGVAQRKYALKSGIITFENSVAILGKPAAQRQVLYFDDYGMRERKELYEGDTLREAALCDGMHLYTLVFEESTAYKGGKSTQGTEAPFRRDTTKGKSWTKLPAMKVAGRVCETIRSVQGDDETTLAGWNGIVLFAESSSGGIHTSSKAVKISENAKISPEMFRVPASFRVR